MHDFQPVLPRGTNPETLRKLDAGSQIDVTCIDMNHQRQQNYDPETFRQDLKRLPARYTQRLARARNRASRHYSKKFNRIVASHLQGNVLEIGAGAEGILYKLLNTQNVHSWTALEINPHAANKLAKSYRKDPNFHAVEECFTHYEKSKFDTICGLSSLDSFIRMPEAIQRIFDKLKPGGKFFHLQDLRPTSSAIFDLLRSDKNIKDSLVIGWSPTEAPGGVDYGIEYLVHDSGEVIESHDYLNKRIHEIALDTGFASSMYGRKELNVPGRRKRVKQLDNIRKHLTLEATNTLSFGRSFSYCVLEKPL